MDKKYWGDTECPKVETLESDEECSDIEYDNRPNAEFDTEE